MSRMDLLLRFVTLVNHFIENYPFFNGLACCLNFNQMSFKRSMPLILVSSFELINRVIHRFRGYLESALSLNWLTIL
jgi:hypothetical protein